MERFTFSITWAGGGSARLMYLLDNGALIATDLAGEPGKVSISYQATPAAVHVLEWALLYPGQARQTLQATLDRGTGPRPLKAEAQAKNLWSGEAVAS